ncbi:unnamed protein product [Meganyctiphanes norvegica]|uniref:Troponin T n=1 Tax=Meganyctiphanes norvegica TaxID=48144 RepID=A0AAV2RSF7_MEGNR
MEDTEDKKMNVEVLKEEMKKRQEEAEELKRQEAKRIEERRQAIADRCGESRNTDGLSDEQLKEIMNQHHERLFMCESQKYDLEQKVLRNQFEIDELYKHVYDLKGKFIKPKLNKVHHEFDDTAVQAK